MEVNHFHRFWGGTHFGVFDGSGSGSGSHFPPHQRHQIVISTSTSTSLPQFQGTKRPLSEKLGYIDVQK